jgi:hypothetical protein
MSLLLGIVGGAVVAGMVVLACRWLRTVLPDLEG